MRKQLSDWGVNYFDLYYIHFPVSLQYVDPSVRYPPGWYRDGARKEVVRGKATLQSTWGAMEALVGAGLAKSIGISNYNGALVLDLLAYARIVPQVLQIEHHPYLTQAPLLELCRREGIAVTGYSSLGPQSFLGLGMKFAEDFQALFSHPVVVAVAGKHGRTPAQVLLRWSTQRGVAVIPKSSSLERLRQNLDVCSFDLSGQELKDISALDCGFRFNNPLNVSLASPPHIIKPAERCQRKCGAWEKLSKSGGRVGFGYMLTLISTASLFTTLFRSRIG